MILAFCFMTSRALRHMTFPVLFCLVAASLCQAQIIYGDPSKLSGQLIYQSWTLTGGGQERKLHQVAVPFYAFVPLRENLELHLDGAFSNSSADGLAANPSVSSLSNPSARAFYSFSDDRFFASVGFLFPTSKKELDPNQAKLAELLSGDYLAVPIKQVTEGAGAVLQLGTAHQRDQFLYGGSVSYYYAGKYKFLKGTEDYDPGDQFTFRGSGAWQAKNGRVDLDIAYKYYLSDKIGGSEMFKNGGQFSLGLGGSHGFSHSAASLNLVYIIRDKDSRQYGSAFRYEDFNSNGKKAALNGAFAFYPRPGLTTSILASYRWLSSNDYAEKSELYFGKSHLFGIGGEIGWSGADKRLSLFGRAVVFSGQADNNAIDVSGIELGLGGRLQL